MRRTDHAIRPFIRWAGSKRAVLSKLLPYVIKSGGRYIEPFVGSAALFFGANPKRAILSDLNKELIDTFLAVRRSPEAVSQYLDALPNTQSDYYRIRSVPPAALAPAQRAARFIYLNRFCFNGLYRTNSKGDFNVPYGRPKNDNRPTVEELKTCSGLLRKAKIECGDFDEVVRNNLKPKDVVYLDPPYALSTRRIFREYGREAFTGDDLLRLRELLRYIDKSGATFVLSYAYNNDVAEFFAEWNCERILVQRNIAGFSSFRKRSAELVVSNRDRVEAR